MIRLARQPIFIKVALTMLLAATGIVIGQAVSATTPQVTITTQAAGCAKSYYCVVQPVISDTGATDGTVITATVSGGPVLSNATATVTNGVATFQGFQFTSGGTGGTSYTITFSDGATSATQELIYYEPWGNITVSSTNSGAGAVWASNSYFSTAGSQAGNVSASTLATKLIDGDVYLIGNSVAISSAISFTGLHTLYLVSVGTITVDAPITATEGGSVAFYNGSTGFSQTPVSFSAAANITTNGGNFSVSAWTNNGLDPVKGIGNVVNFNGNTVDVGSGNATVTAKSIQYGGSITGACINLASSTFRATGAGNITLKATPVSNKGYSQSSAVGVKVGSASTIQVEDGAINLSSTANTETTTNTSSLGGIVLTGASGQVARVAAVGTGSITMSGTVGDVSNWENTGFDGGKSAGVQINRYSSVTTASGNISITGTTGNLTQASFPSTGSMTGADTLGYYGVRIGDAANVNGSQPTVSAGGNGNITITGTSGISTINYGTYVEGGTITTANGSITINGTASSDAGTKTAVSIGVVLSGQTPTTLGSSITSSGGGAISIVGYSGANTFSGTGNGSSEGVRVGQSTVDTTGGAVTISGTTNGLGNITVAATGGGTAVFLHNGVAFAKPATGYNQLYPTASTTTSIGASASSVTVNGYTGNATNASGISWYKFLGTTFGGSNCTANFTFNADRMLAYYGYGASSANFYVDTSGSVSVHSVNSDFASGDVTTTTTAYFPALMVSPRVSSLEITPITATSSREISVQQDTVMNSANFSMHVRGGAVTVSSYSDTGTVGNLGVEANGNFTLNKLPATNLALQFTGPSRNTIITSGARGTIKVTPADAAGISAVWGVPSQLAIVSGTPAPNAGIAFNSHVIQAKDAYGNALTANNIYGDATVDGDGPTATVDLTSANGATFAGGSTAIDVVSGTTGVSFTGLTIDLPGTYSLTYSGTFRGVALTQVTSATFVVGGGAPTITLVYPSVTYAPTGTISPTTATVSSGGTKSYSTTSSNTICTVNSSTGAITPVGGGTCSVKLTAAAVTGPPSYLSGSLTVDVTINKAAQAAVTMSTLSITYGATATLSASGGTGTGAYVYSTSTNGCSLSGAVLSTTLGASSACTVSVYRASNTQYLDSASANFTITVAKANQATLVAPSGTNIAYAGSLDLASVTFTGGSGSGAIGFSTATSGCNIVGTTLTTTNNAGTTCSITSTKALDNNYNVGSGVTLTVTVAKINQTTLEVTSTSATHGANLALTYTGGNGTGTLTWSVVSGDCTISVTTLTPTAATSCVIKVSRASSTNYNAATSADTTVTIAKGTQNSVSITSTATIPYAGSRSVGVAGGSGTGSFTITTATAGCSISGSTLTTTLEAGSTCVLTVVRAGDANWNDSAPVDQNVIITKINQASLMAPAGTMLTYANSTGLDLTTLTFTGGSGTGAMTYATATGGCSITASVLTSSNSVGTSCSVTATKAADTNYNSGSVSFTISITQANQGTITVTSANTGTWGTNMTLTSTGGAAGSAATWQKVSGSICSISGTTLSSTGAGSCVVKVNFSATSNYMAASSSDFTITFNKKNQSPLSWNLTSTSVAYQSTLNLATSGGTGTGAVVYSVSGSSSCSITGSTLIPSDAGSTCEVTATKVADSNYNSADTTTQTITVTKISQATLSFSNSSSMTYGQSVTLLATGGSGTGVVAYSVSNAGATGCSVTGSTLTVNGAGTCAVSAVRAASTNYNASTAAALSIAVAKASQTVSFTSAIPAEPIAGDTYTATAQTSSGLTPTITVASGPCSISGGVVTLTSSGNCVLSAASTSTNQYLAATSVTQTIAIGQRNQTISFSATVRAMSVKTYGDPAFYAEASSTESTFTPVFSRGSATTNNACSVSSSGVVVILAVGDCEIEANQAGDAAVAAASTIKKTITIVPDQANAPFITSVSAGHESITAAFVKPTYTGGSAITGYQIAATAGSTTITNSACAVALSGTSESCTVTGLVNGANYRIKVAAITAAGIGLYSDLSASRTPATNPAAVSAFTAVPDNTSLVLNWLDPISLGGGQFDSYRIFYKKSSDANYTSSYINVISQSPTTYTITGLVNGESYDAKIVTVTSANTIAMESNTAEVRETPRTVPEAPATIEVLEVSGSLVITWSTPQSDGGNAITEYRVTINGTTCTLANALDNLCTIPVPTSGGTYPIEVKAKNDAGYGSAASATFTKAGVPSSGGGSSGGGSSGGGAESAPTNGKAIQVISLSAKSVASSGGQVVTVTGKNFTGVSTVLIDGVKARIISVADGILKFVAPSNSNGPATLTIKSPVASAEVVDAFVYVNGSIKPSVRWVLGFIQANTTLNNAAKAKLRSGLATNQATVAVTCVGYQSYSYNTAKDKATAIGRAKKACDYLKGINPKLSVKTVIARTNLTGPASRKLAVQYRSSK